MRATGFVVAAALASLVAGCSASTQKSAIETAMNNDAERHRAFEATARALDEHPEWVDELYRVARKHPPMFDRFLADTTADLGEPELARAVAELLAKNPAAVEQVLVATVDAVRKDPKARAALDTAMARRSSAIADVLTDRRATVRRDVEETVKAAEVKGQARRGLLEAMRAEAPRLAELLASDPDVLMVVTAALIKEELHDPTRRSELIKRLAEQLKP